MKIKEQASTELDFEKKNTIFELWKALKDSIFNVLFVLLDSSDDEEESTIDVYYEAGADFIQMFEFPFNEAVQQAWNGGETLSKITAFVNIFSFVSYLPGVGYGTFLTELYILIVVIIIIIVDIVYVSYSFSKKKFRFTWPLVILGQVVPLFVTVFFIPITEILLSVAQCIPSEYNPLVTTMSSYPDVVCWEGWHLFHSVVTLTFCGIFIFISTIVTLAMFEPRMSSNKVQARQNSNAEIAFIINKIVCQCIFNFVPFDGSWTYAIILFVLSSWMFYEYSANDPYYNSSVSRFFRICSSYYFWTNFMLILSQFLEMFSFTGGLVAWIGGLPFIAIIIFFGRRNTTESISSSNLKFKSGEQLDEHLRCILMLIQTKEKDKNSYMLLIGYIQKHKEACMEEDCPLKATRKKKEDEEGEMEENCKQLLKHIDRTYTEGLKKFPNSTKLRLSYALFHLERTKNKNKAYEQFVRAEKTNPNFSQQFIIYRFKKIIKENLESEEDEENNSDLIELIRFDNHVSLCEEAMTFSVRLHKEFWTELMEETPDLIKLNQIGSRITQTVQTAKSNFAELIKIQSAIPQVLHNYAVYLISVLQETYAGEKILELAKKGSDQKHFDLANKTSAEDYLKSFEKNDVALFVMSAKEESLGKILRCNLMFTEVFGYFKEEITDCRLQKIIPQMYIEGYTQFMKESANRYEEMSKRLHSYQGFIKRKAGYIIPVTYQIAFDPLQEVFLTRFHVQHLQKRSFGYMLVDTKGIIRETTTSIYSFINNNKDDIRRHKLPLNDVFPGMQAELNGYPQQKMIDYELRGVKERYSVVVQKIFSNRFSNESSVEGENSEEKRLPTDEKHLMGYNIRLEKMERKQNPYSQGNSFVKQKNQSFDVGPSSHSELLRFYNTEVFDYEIPEETFREEVQFVNYGVKIKTLRLTASNEMHMIYNPEDEDKYDNDFQQSDDEDLGRVRFDDDRYAEVIKNAINTNLDHNEIVCLRWSTFFFLLAVDVIIVVSFLMTSKQYQSVGVYTNNVYNRGKTMIFLNDMVANSLDPNPVIPYAEAAGMITNFSNQFDSDVDMQVVLQDGTSMMMGIGDAVTLLLGRLREYYLNNSSPDSMRFTYINFMNSFFPTLVSYTQFYPITPFSQIVSYFLMAVLLSLSLMMICVFQILKIEKKRFDILIWFLDIPIPYVTHLTQKCDKFIKSFGGMKNVIPEDRAEELFEEYVDKKNQGMNEIEEEQKARKSLISKHKKKKLHQRMDWSFSKFLLLVGVGGSYVVFNSFMNSTTFQTMNILKSRYESLVADASKTALINIVSQLKARNPTFDTISSDMILSIIKTSFEGEFNTNNIKQFNLQIPSISNQLSSIYEQAYFHSMCTNFTDSAYDECTSVIMGSVGHGILSMQYLMNSIPFDTLNQTQLLYTNIKYVQPTFLYLMSSFKKVILNQVNLVSKCLVIFVYVFTFSTFLLFITFGLMWMRSLNTGLNQTIQMLNMIPLQVLPSSNKETKRFIRWIIKESNKKKHQED